MKFFTPVALLTAVSLPALVSAYDQEIHGALRRDVEQRHVIRQGPPPGVDGAAAAPPSSPAATPPAGTQSPPPPNASTNPAAPPPGSGTPPPAGATNSASGVTAPPAVPTTTFTFSLDATNPTAIPLTAIVSNATSSPTRPLDAIFTPGAQPNFLPGAPPLPNGRFSPDCSV